VTTAKKNVLAEAVEFSRCEIRLKLTGMWFAFRLAAQFGYCGNKIQEQCGHSKPAELSASSRGGRMLACALVKESSRWRSSHKFSDYVMYVMYVTWTFSA
jgi:hypothetical protein